MLLEDLVLEDSNILLLAFYYLKPLLNHCIGIMHSTHTKLEPLHQAPCKVSTYFGGGNPCHSDQVLERQNKSYDNSNTTSLVQISDLH